MSRRISSFSVPSAATLMRLRLATGEERRAVRARSDADLDRDVADLALAAAVGALLVDGDALADDRLLDLVEGELRALAVLAVGVGVGIAGVLLQHGLLDRLGRRLALELVLDLRRRVERGAVALADLAHELLVDDGRLDDELLLAGHLGQLALGARRSS